MADDAWVELRPPHLDRAQRTYIVLGAPRGGTSLMAGLLRIFGIYMGENLGHQHEDRVFRRETPLEEKLAAIAERNATYDVWGWKMPNTIHYIGDVLKHVRNPHFIVVYRNPLAIAKSSAERDGRPFTMQLLNVPINHYTKMNRFLMDDDNPVAFSSFESADQDKHRLLFGLVDFLGVQPTRQQLDAAFEFCDPKRGYRKLKSEGSEVVVARGRREIQRPPRPDGRQQSFRSPAPGIVQRLIRRFTPQRGPVTAHSSLVSGASDRIERECALTTPRNGSSAPPPHKRRAERGPLHKAWELAAEKNAGEYRLYELDRYKIWLNISESVMMYARSIGKYEIAKSVLIQRTLGQGDVFVDVGANKGDFTLLAAAVVGTSGTVLSIEPHPENVHWINASIAENGFENIEVLQLACSDRDGTAQLHVARRSGGHSIVRSGRDAIEVPTRRLDDLVTERGIERVHAIKIDVEGAERLVLDGAAETLRRHRPVVFLDVHNLSAQDYAAIADLIRSLDYKMARTNKPDVVLDALPHGRGDYVMQPSK